MYRLPQAGLLAQQRLIQHLPLHGYHCGRTGYTGPTGRTGPRHDPPDPSAYSTHTSLALLLASCSRLSEVYPSF